MHRKTKVIILITTAMSLIYIINCRHCGAHYEYGFVKHTSLYCGVSVNGGFGGDVAREKSLPSFEHIDTECSIRCTVCRARLNATEEDFRSQVTIGHC